MDERLFNSGDVNKILRVSDVDRTRNHGYKLDTFRFKKEIGRCMMPGVGIETVTHLSIFNEVCCHHLPVGYLPPPVGNLPLS